MTESNAKPIRRLVRVLRVAQVRKDDPGLTGLQLAMKFGVSLRTIRRDLELLEEVSHSDSTDIEVLSLTEPSSAVRQSIRSG